MVHIALHDWREAYTMGIHDRFRQLVNGWERRIFVADDAVALARGWNISRSPKGFGRVYRDPRWDLISECESCRGDAGSEPESCSSCGGCGTVQRSRTDISCGGAA